MTITTDIAIIGGGLSGALMAICAEAHGFTACVIDAQPSHLQNFDDFDGRSYAMAHTSVRVLKALGLWQHLEQTAQPILDIKISNGGISETPSPFLLHFDHHDLEEGPMGHMVEDRILRPLLQEHLKQRERIIYLDETEVIEHNPRQASSDLILKGQKTTVTAQLVIAADGRKSALASSAGITYSGWDYAQTSLVCALEHEKPHRGIAYQHFMPPGPLAILPLKNNRASIVWTETKDNAKTIMGLDADAYLDVLRPRFGDFLGDIRLAGKRFAFPLEMSIAKSLVANRLALVGDAAHGMHPIAGQGLNAGLRDIAALTQIIHDAKQRGEDFGSTAVLNRYQEWRRFDATALPLALDGFNRLFSNHNQFLQDMRALGIGIVNQFPGLKRHLMREAAGLSGELPELMR